MPGRLRKGTGASDKAQDCCNKCCDLCCRLSPWNKLICYAMIALTLGSLVLIIGGAFAADGTDNTSDNICSQPLSGFEGSGDPKEDPVVPIISKNAYIWWLANAGIFCMIMVAMSFVCCCSYIILCCGFSFPRNVRIAGIVGIILILIAFTLYVVWLGFGSYLIGQFGASAAFEKVCRGIAAYVVFMYAYLFIFLGTVVAAILFSIFGSKDDASKKGRDSAKSNLKMPPTKVLTAMV